MDERLLDFLIGRGRYSPFNPEPLVVTGLAIAIATILFVHKGGECFYAGADSGCMGPQSYYGALAIGAALMLAGLYRSFSTKTSV